MAQVDKILRWFVEGEQSRIRTNVGGTHILEDDYKPIWVYMSLRAATKGTRPLKIDITDDGTSIFDDKPSLVNEQSEKTWNTIPQDAMRKDSVIKLNRDQIANVYPGEDLTVMLALERA